MRPLKVLVDAGASGFDWESLISPAVEQVLAENDHDVFDAAASGSFDAYVSLKYVDGFESGLHQPHFHNLNISQCRISFQRSNDGFNERWQIGANDGDLGLPDLVYALDDVVRGPEDFAEAGDPPQEILNALSHWMEQLDSPAGSTARLFAVAEELVQHLRQSLTERDELRRRLIQALGDQQHADDRIRALEAQVTALEAQLLEANAAVAGGNKEFIGQSKMAIATMALTALALLASIASPFVSDALSNDDTAAIVEAQRQTTAAIEAAADPSPIDLSIEAALRCVVDEDER